MAHNDLLDVEHEPRLTRPNAEPVLTKPFERNNIVLCGDCKGIGHKAGDPCDLCGGKGLLHATRSGKLELFRINKIIA